MYYNEQGEEITLEEWCKIISNKDKKIIKQDKLENGFFVSTVYIGLDYGFEEGEKPLIFETMVFPQNTWQDEDVKRYSTKKEALRGHKEMVNKWSNKKAV